jgi:hypothetical protein
MGSNGGDRTHLTQDKDRSRILMKIGVKLLFKKKWRKFSSAKRPRTSHKQFFSMDFASMKCSNVHEQVMELLSFGERPRTGLKNGTRCIPSRRNLLFTHFTTVQFNASSFLSHMQSIIIIANKYFIYSFLK